MTGEGQRGASQPLRNDLIASSTCIMMKRPGISLFVSLAMFILHLWPKQGDWKEERRQDSSIQ
jgi:hypothetical protein